MGLGGFPALVTGAAGGGGGATVGRLAQRWAQVVAKVRVTLDGAEVLDRRGTIQIMTLEPAP